MNEMIARDLAELRRRLEYLERMEQPAGAEQIAFTPTGNITSTDIQAAIEELDSEKITAALDAGKVSKLWESDGGAAAWATNADGVLGGSQDILPLAIGQGLVGRFVNYGVTPTDHFTSGSIPSGYTWQSSPFGGTPSNLSYNLLGSWLRFGNPGANRFFLAKSTTGAIIGTFLYARVIGSSQSGQGVRLDDGTDDNYYELRVLKSGANAVLRIKQRTGGGAVTDTDVNLSVSSLSYMIALRIYDAGGGNHTPLAYLPSEIGTGYQTNISGGSSVSWTPSRVGLIGEATAGTSLCAWDWFTIA